MKNIKNLLIHAKKKERKKEISVKPMCSLLPAYLFYEGDVILIVLTDLFNGIWVSFSEIAGCIFTYYAIDYNVIIADLPPPRTVSFCFAFFEIFHFY